MTTRTRWIIGILLALVIGLAVGLVIVAADNGEDDEPTTVTVQETEAEPAETETEPAPTETAPPDGGVPPGDGQPDGSGGLGFD